MTKKSDEVKLAYCYHNPERAEILDYCIHQDSEIALANMEEELLER